MNFSERDLVIVDIETLGTDEDIHSIIEIGAIKVKQGTLEFIDEANWIVTPDKPIENATPEALALNGFEPDNWIYSIPIYDALNELSEFARDAVLMSWNITFDNRFLERAFKEYGIETYMDYHRLDIPSIYWFLNSGNAESLSMKNAVVELSVQPEPEVHDALNGARTALDCLRSMKELYMAMQIAVFVMAQHEGVDVQKILTSERYGGGYGRELWKN